MRRGPTPSSTARYHSLVALRAGPALMPTPDFLAASLPLFEVDVVDVVEWSFDTAWFDDDLLPWMPPLFADFAAGEALLAHGVAYSALAARWEPRQETWLARLREGLAAAPRRGGPRADRP